MSRLRNSNRLPQCSPGLAGSRNAFVGVSQLASATSRPPCSRPPGLPLTAPCCAIPALPRSWTAEGGHSVRLLSPGSLEEELKLDVEALRSSPVRLEGCCACCGLPPGHGAGL